MNESSANNNYVNLPAVPPAEEPAVPLDWRNAAAPVLALALSILYWAVFAVSQIAEGYGPGLGVPVFVAAYFGAVLLMLGRKTRWNAGGVCLMAAALILSLCCALYAHTGMTVLNCFIILALSAMATFSLSGQGAYPAFDIRTLPETVQLSVLALFTRVDRPFKLFRVRKQANRAILVRGAITILITIAILAVVLALLSSADTVFGSLLPDVEGWLTEDFSAMTLWKLARVVLLALFIASGLYFIRESDPNTKAQERPTKEVYVMPFLFPTALLDVIYLVFCAVQLRYLFGGAEAAAMAGGWAEYARTGFFQLVAVAVINLGMCLIGADSRRFGAKGGPILRIADGLMLLLTAVILLSAARRMQLYILAFGLSILRILTLWGIAVIAVGIFAAGWKLYKPGFSFFSVLGGFALGTWCLFCLCSPAGIVANYNVDAYLDGTLGEVDVYYLRQLSTDAAPALQRLAEEADGEDLHIQHYLDLLAEEADDAQTYWARWKASCTAVE